ncbi:MAG TPA: hypothetical protein VNO81_09385 [Candidatus Nitrosotenuis sp.]|nr:hypothetical protein [Candidatus Nitrosotenuis sp.]
MEREVERLFGFERPYALIGERDFARRLAACQLQFPQAFGRLQRALDARADRARVERFLVGFPCGSGHECLFDLCLLALNALPARLSPLRLGFADPRLQDPATRRYVGHCLMPSLVLYRPSLTEVYWPQVPVRTERQPYTLDFLVALHDGRNQVWLNVEVDGPGHEGSGDEDRARQIRLPTMRLRSETLLRPDFPCWLDDRLRQLLLGHGRPHLRRLRRWP